MPESSGGPPVSSADEAPPLSPAPATPEAREDLPFSPTVAMPAISEDPPVSPAHDDRLVSPALATPDSREEHPASPTLVMPEVRGEPKISPVPAVPIASVEPKVSSALAAPIARPLVSGTPVQLTTKHLLAGVAVIVAAVCCGALWISSHTTNQLDQLNSELNTLRATVGTQTADVKELRNGISNVQGSVAELGRRLEEKSARPTSLSEERVAKMSSAKPAARNSGEAVPSSPKATRAPIESLAKEDLRYLLDVTSTRCALRGSEASADEKKKCSLEIERIKSALGRADSQGAR
jgi:outer membrane murein-binding lipoprotein Lpp